ncbi:MAG: 2-oxoacid:acceptor oxidoreductase family protein [Magnetococcus sp. WYHC-3]
MATMKAEDQQAFPYPGIPGTADGSDAVAYVEVRVTDGAAAYPITPSTNIGMNFQVYVANGFRNLWGRELAWMELESEHSSASACEGFALAGGRITNFTSAQGLVLMKEVLFTISGKRLPHVLHVSSRTLTSQALCIHAGHDDVMAVADTGWGILFAQNIQATADLALICHHAAEASRTPFMNVQDGFILSHTIENLNFPEDEMMRQYLGDSATKIRDLFDPEHPMQTGTVQNQDAYMQGKMAQRYVYSELEAATTRAMDEYYQLTGRRYELASGFMMDDAEYAIVCMGSFAETAMAALPTIRRELGLKVGVVMVTCYRPFPSRRVVDLLKNCRAIAVVERCDIPTMVDNPLTTDIEASFAKALMGVAGYPSIDRIPFVQTGVAGLGSRNTTPGHMMAISKNMAAGKAGKRFFTVGVQHPDELAWDWDHEPDVRPAGGFSVRTHSVGGYGSVTTNKVISTMLGEIFGFKVQAAPKYGSEKKGLPTNSFLSVSAEQKILTHCDLTHVDFVPLMDPTAWHMGNPMVGLTRGGIVFQHTDEGSPQALWNALPPYAKWFIKEHDIQFYGVDTIAIARESCQSDSSLIQRFQGVVLLGVFLRVTPFQKNAKMADEALFAAVRKPLEKYFGKRGQKVVDDNLAAVRRGYDRVMHVTRDIIDATSEAELKAGYEEWQGKGRDVSII